MTLRLEAALKLMAKHQVGLLDYGQEDEVQVLLYGTK